MEAPMSGISGDCSAGDSAAYERTAAEWAALSSEHERLVLLPENPVVPASSGPMRWAELASQRERLLEHDAPLSRLASSSQQTSGPRLVVRVA
jgi:hypothetical protein